MAQGTLREICITHARREPMISVSRAAAYVGRGLSGDRYARGGGSYNQGQAGKRQITLMHDLAFAGQKLYTFSQSRRNLLISGDNIELAWLLAKGHSITIGDVVLKLVGYCDPCHVPTQIAGRSREDSFRKIFWERGGVIAEVARGGIIKVGDSVMAPDKGYGNTWGA